MTQPANPGTSPAVAMLQAQIKEMEAILAQAQTDLNTVAGSERLAKWKARTISLIAQQIGPKEAQRVAGTQPGPCFTRDLLEELGDEVELYRNVLFALIRDITKAG